MTSKDKRFIKEWPRTESKGKIRYVVLITTVFTFSFIIINPVIGMLLDLNFEPLEYYKNDLLRNTIAGLITGLLMGFYFWTNSKSRFKKLKALNSEE